MVSNWVKKGTACASHLSVHLQPVGICHVTVIKCPFLLFFYCLSSCIITLFFDTWTDISELKPLSFFHLYSFALFFGASAFQFHAGVQFSSLSLWSFTHYSIPRLICISSRYSQYILLFTLTLRLICISSRISTGYGPWLLKSQPFPFAPTLDITTCYSHLTHHLMSFVPVVHQQFLILRPKNRCYSKV